MAWMSFSKFQNQFWKSKEVEKNFKKFCCYTESFHLRAKFHTMRPQNAQDCADTVEIICFGDRSVIIGYKIFFYHLK